MFFTINLISLIIAASTILITRSLAHPASLMSLIWAAVFAGVYLVREDYYSTDLTPLSLLFFAEVLFVLVALIFAQVFQKAAPNVSVRPFRPVMLFALLICTAALPLYYRAQTAEIHAGFFNPLAQIRMASLNGDNSSVYFNFVILSLVVVAYALIDLLRRPSPWRGLIYAIALCVAMAFAVLTGSKNSILNLVISQFTLFAILRPRRQWQAIALTSVAALTLFSAGIYFVNFGGREAQATNAAVLQTASEYLIGGTLAFSSQFETVMEFENNQNLINGLSSLLHVFGIEVGGGSIHYPFLNISETSVTNVYTILFPLTREYGIAGAFVAMGLLGMLCAYMYANARRSAGWLVFYALLSNAIIQTVISDSFSFGISLYIKYALIIVSFSAVARFIAYATSFKVAKI